MLMAYKALKCVVIGDGAVGKTCLLMSYATNIFPQSYVPTVFDNYVVSVSVDGLPYSLALFDTAGQEDYDRLRPLAYPETDIFVVCFSVVQPSSFHNITEKWIPELLHFVPDAQFVLVATQTDRRENVDEHRRLARIHQRPVTTKEGMRLARKLGAAAYVECSALTQRGLKTVFDEAIHVAMQPCVRRNRKPKTVCSLL